MLRHSMAVQEAAGADTPALLFSALCHSQALQPILQTCWPASVGQLPFPSSFHQLQQIEHPHERNARY